MILLQARRGAGRGEAAAVRSADAAALPAAHPRLVTLVAAVILCLAIALAPGRGAAGDPCCGVEAIGLLWLPANVEAVAPIPAVIALHDALGIDPRGWRYAEQLTAAGIAVLHRELYDTSADGAGPSTDDDAAALARLAAAAAALAEDPRFGGMRLGILAFGAAGGTALRAAAAPGLGEHVAALVLLYPGCATLRDAAEAMPRLPVLLLHGDADPANPLADCAALVARLSRGAPVRHIRHAGAGYALDLPPSGVEEVMTMPWPGSPGRWLPVSHRPAIAEFSAAQVAGFLARALLPQPR
jgi:dienelactone hydrolase